MPRRPLRPDGEGEATPGDRARRLILKGPIGILILVGLLCYLVWNYFGDPTDVNGYFPKCILWKLTGIKCAGCGGQRALHFLMHGNFGEAVRYNFFLVCVMPFYLLGFCFAPLRKNMFFITAGLLAMLVFILARNLPGANF